LNSANTRHGFKFLIDTNILIPVEPTASSNLEANSEPIARLLGLMARGKHEVFIHPLVELDLNRDRNVARKQTRRVLLQKYQRLQDPPSVGPKITDVLGETLPHSNDHVDHSLLAAVIGDAVDLLVTEDRAIKSKAERLGISERIIDVRDALTILISLAQEEVRLPPAVRETLAHSLDESDPIFLGFRSDYKGFDDWFRKCKLEHRRSWVIDGSAGRIAALCIIKEEASAELGPGGSKVNANILKICSLKVAEPYYGFRFGELLLKTVFTYLHSRTFEYAYVTCFDRHTDLMTLLSDFGFKDTGTPTSIGERVLVKRLTWTTEEESSLDPLPFHITFGPAAIDLKRPDYYVIPIQPAYHDLLFPDAAVQKLLMVGRDPFGNGIRKAYLCKSPLRRITPGSVLLFYRSEDAQAVSVVGVAEDTLVSDSPSTIARYVGKRTVYSFAEIDSMCARPVLAIRFRQSRVLKNSCSIGELLKRGVLVAPPQSIVTIRPEKKRWLAKWIQQQS
jgi:hypothetical protein